MNKFYYILKIRHKDNLDHKQFFWYIYKLQINIFIIFHVFKQKFHNKGHLSAKENTRFKKFNKIKNNLFFLDDVKKYINI